MAADLAEEMVCKIQSILVLDGAGPFLQSCQYMSWGLTNQRTRFQQLAAREFDTASQPSAPQAASDSLRETYIANRTEQMLKDESHFWNARKRMKLNQTWEDSSFKHSGSLFLLTFVSVILVFLLLRFGLK